MIPIQFNTKKPSNGQDFLTIMYEALKALVLSINQRLTEIDQRLKNLERNGG